MKTAALLMLLVGCDVAWDVPHAPVVPVAESAQADVWSARVLADITVWNDALVERGCAPPFQMSDSGYEIVLVPRADWTDEDHVGLQHSDRLEIRSSPDGAPPAGGVLLHELGHAMGLEHVYGRSSLMNEVGAPRFMPGDVDYAAEVLGC